MASNPSLKELDREIRTMKHSAENLFRMGESIPAVRCNALRLLASLKMLEINICDIAGAGEEAI